MEFNSEFSKNFELYGLNYEKFKNFDKSEIWAYRKEKFKEIVNFAANESQFYKEYYKDIDLLKVQKPEELPMINKQLLIENFQNIIVPKDINKESLKEYFKKPFSFERRYLDKYLAFHTSGSTGNPAYIVWGDREFAISTANYFYKLSSNIYSSVNMEDNLKKVHRVAYIGIMDDYVGGNSWAYAIKAFAELKMFSVFSPLNKLCEDLNDFKPNIIMTKPSLLGELSRMKRDNKLSIELEKIIFAGEMISPNDSRDIEEYFGVKASNSYSTCETGPIAFQMEDQVDCLDVFEDMVWLEIVDDDGNPINEYYKLGSIVITNLYNKTMPIIRYNLGDKAYFVPGKDKERFNRISYILGRGTSFFLFKGNNGKDIKVSEYPFWSLYISGVLRYQVIQNDFRSLKVRIQWEDSISVEEKKNIIEGMKKKIDRILVGHAELKDFIKLTFEETDKIEPNSAGKIQITFPYKKDEME